MAEKPVAEGTAAEGAVAEKPKARRGRRTFLMLGLPLLVALAGGYFWVTGGRYVSTENAYVQQPKVSIAPDVAGRIVTVAVRENQRVGAGDVLFQIDPEPYRLALEQAEAALAGARLDVDRLRSAYHSATADLQTAKDTLAFRKNELARQQKLVGNGYVTKSQFEETRLAEQEAEQQLRSAEQQVASALAALGGSPDIATDDHPAVLEALANRDQAKFNLERTRVAAPRPGIVSQTGRLQIGQYVAAGTAVMSLVEPEDTWVEANFKETELTGMAVGQQAELTFDTYPGRSFEAEVASIGAGTGAEFSLLPAQNATGNWVKVVQRIPVRLHIVSPPQDVALRTGMSASVSVDTGHVRGLPKVIRSALAVVGIGPSVAQARAD
ncbi:HlyD family secretion protein [Rhizobiales bacterium L72]|uniref:HlyD family secretion protein n=2 Tax=Propylenella binzhouense TaxID=2555902 RepID=A0A964T7B1_9HYPH|nr:HlyD family secretion protein [Propylenella binzhouense]